jgi:inhibitor of cysteine peptidase
VEPNLGLERPIHKENEMNKIISRLGFMMILVCMVGACTSNSSGSKTVELSKADSGKTIELQNGDILVITLEGNPTTGFTWEAQPPLDDSVIKLSAEPKYQADSNLAGSGGKLTFTYQAVKTGQVNLSLVYHRPWESIAPLNTFLVTIKVSQ